MSILRPCDKEVNTLLRRLFLVFTIIISTKPANAQDDQVDMTSPNFQPSLFIVIGVLSLMFSLTLLLLIYAKWCHQDPPRTHDHDHDDPTMYGPHTRFSGLSKEVIESLPFFRFSSLKGAKRGLQCAVCLTDFADVEILRLLPKCKHGFHIECIDQWLERHATCPLCRQTVTSEDLSTFANSCSMRFIMEGKSSVGETSSNFEVVVENDNQTSSVFCKKEQSDEEGKFQRVNHRIVVSDVVFRNRWSDVRSSDLMFLNSEMLGFMSSDRFSSSNIVGPNHDSTDLEDCHNAHHRVLNIREETGRKTTFEHEIGKVESSSSNTTSKSNIGFDNTRQTSSISADKRAMSEITAVSRFDNFGSTKDMKELDNDSRGENVMDVITRSRKWFRIARKTVEWFANRENNSNMFVQHQQQQEKCQGTDNSHTLEHV